MLRWKHLNFIGRNGAIISIFCEVTDPSYHSMLPHLLINIFMKKKMTTLYLFPSVFSEHKGKEKVYKYVKINLWLYEFSVSHARSRCVRACVGVSFHPYL